MLRPLAFIPVWQEHRHARRLFPLVFRRGDVLIDDGLRAVAKVAKLRFPHHEGIARYYCVAILKSQDTFFRE